MTRGDRWVALVESWLDKADGDLRASAACLQHPAVPGWIVGFHLQQAVEKTLKGLLVLHQREPPRSYLVGLVQQVEAAVLAARQAVERQRTGGGGDGSG